MQKTGSQATLQHLSTPVFCCSTKIHVSDSDPMVAFSVLKQA